MKRKIRPIRIEGNIAYVPLTKGYEAVIDAADVPLVDGWNWTAVEARNRIGGVRAVYAIRAERRPMGKSIQIYLHHSMIPKKRGFEVDHIDGDGLNNRRVNLRRTTRAQNGKNMQLSVANSSGFKGVCWDKRRGKWYAYIHVDRKQHPLGRFNSAEEAAEAYAEASKKLHREFGRIA